MLQSVQEPWYSGVITPGVPSESWVIIPHIIRITEHRDFTGDAYMELDNEPGLCGRGMDPKEPLPREEGGNLMAKPIAATPELRGQDLANFVHDLKRPDRNQELRASALQDLRRVTKGK